MVALEQMAFPPCEVLFLDDGAANVNSARSLGMAARVVANPVHATGLVKADGLTGHPTPINVIVRGLNLQVPGKRRYAVEGDEDAAGIEEHSADSAHEYAA
jgi:hypothetical protein